MPPRRFSSITWLVVGLALTASADAADVTSSNFQSAFYKDFPLFSTVPSETAPRTPIEHFGPVGIGIDLVLPPFQMRISRIDKGSPAEAVGTLEVGQMIESINGQTLKDIDPRIQLGGIITKAEATNGIVTFLVKAKPEAKTEKVVVKIPVLGSYSKTWPLDCPKSERIVRGQADYLARTNANGMGLGLLFLLSTGEEQDLEVARGWIKEMVAKHKDVKRIDNSNPWHSGYNGIGLCEYYLRTGDESVLPLISMHADYLKRNMYNGGWNQFGGVNFSYGHLNAAGIPATAFLLLARECGAEVDEYLLQETLKHFYRFAGHGNVPYGDGMPDTGFVDNGKVGKMAFFMAAAATLTPEGEKSVYAKARDISAVRSFYSTSWMFHGHTGGGIGEIWRGAAMGLLHDKQPLKYREFMDNRQWFYELSRHFDGSMGIVGNHHGGGGYDVPGSWGIGISLAYTIPRKTLRITGAPASKFAKPYQLPKRPWGTAADEAFFSMRPAADRNGRVQEWDAERLANDASWPILRRVNDPAVTPEVLLMYARHPDQGVREMAAQVIGKKGADPLILELIRHEDPRARQAGLMAINSPARLNDEVAAVLLRMINDPEESWWVVVHALNRLGMARPELLAPHVDRLCYWLEHEDWWFRAAALGPLTGLAYDERYYQKIWPLIGVLMTDNRVGAVAGAMRGFLTPAQKAPPAVRSMIVQVLSRSYANFPKTLTAPGGLNLSNRAGPPSPVTYLEQELARGLSWAASGPEALETLYTLAKKRFPEQTLPHREYFLGATPEALGPKLSKIMRPTILESLIPEHVGKNWKSLRALAAAEVKTGVPGGRNDALEQLADLYRRAGDTTDYGWHPYGPDRLLNEWDYFSFDPPETKEWDGTPRYRPVTMPKGMTDWFMPEFRASKAAKAGWRKGLAPFANMPENGGCTSPICGCGDKPNTPWEKEVLVMRRTFELPPMKPGHRYRLLVGGRSHVYTGDGWAVFVNGRMIAEAKSAGGMGSGGLPKGGFITTDWFEDFKKRKVVIAAIAFQSNKKRDHFNIWLEEMKIPPFDDKQLRQWARETRLLSADWQAVQDPNRNADDPNAGRFTWNGKTAAYPALLGNWTTVAVVPSLDVFDPAAPVDANRAPFKAISFKPDGTTDEPLRLWTGNTLLDLERQQALKMAVNGDFLFIEAGGFSDKNPVGWKSPLIVLQRAPL
jgi:hypothetical protein